MSDKEKVMQMIVTAEDKATKVLNSISKNVDGFSRKIDNFSRSGASIANPIAGATTSLLALEGAILSGGAAMTVFAIKVSGDFDAAFREIATLIDVPLSGLGRFKEDILNYAGSSTQSLEQITTAIYGAVSAGVDYGQSLDVVQQSERLAVASKSELSESLVLLVSSLNAYGESTDEAARYSDALFTTVKMGQTTLPELSQSLANVTGIAAGAGVPFETLLSAIAALTAAGAPTSQAITQIKAALSNMIKPSEKAQKTAADLGIQFDAAALKSRGFEGVLGDVAKATGGNVSEMAQLFKSTEALNGVIALTSTGADKFSSSLIAMESASGATEGAFDKMVDAVGLGHQKIKNSIETMLVAIGTPFLDELGGMQNAVAAIFEAIRSSINIGSLGEFTAELEKMAQDAQITIEAIANNLPEALSMADYQPIIDGIDAVKVAVLGLFDGADLSTAEGLSQAIQSVGAAFNSLSTFSAATIEALTPVMSVLQDLVVFLSNVDEETLRFAGTVGGVAVIVAPALSALGSLATILKAVGAVLPVVGTAFGALTGPVGATVAVVGATAATVGKLVGEIVSWKAATDEAAAAEQRAAGSAGGLKQRYEEISEQIGITISDSRHFHQLIKDGIIVAGDAAGEWKKTTDVQRDFAAEVRAAADAGYTFENMLDDTKRGLAAIGLEFDAAGNKIHDATVEAGQFGSEVRKSMMMEGDTIRGTFSVVSSEFGKAAVAAKDAGKETDAFRLKLLDLASDERLKSMKIGVDLEIAKIESDTEKFKTLMDGLSNSVTSTGETLASMYDSFANVNQTYRKESFLREQIEKENDRRDDSLKKQGDLVDAQIRNLNERSNALKNGDALITVSGDGLAPELEAFMWKILETIQIRASEDEAAFLLGI